MRAITYCILKEVFIKRDNMNIREIAKIAGVSPATVSKIINGKDDSIRLSTREKVLGIVKEHNYAPGYLSNNLANTYLIGLLLLKRYSSSTLAESLSLALQKEGYHAVLAFSDGTEEDTKKHMEAFLRLGVDALITEGVSALESLSVPMVDMIYGNNMSYVGIYERMLTCAIQRIWEIGHTEVACVVRHDCVGRICRDVCHKIMGFNLNVIEEDNINLTDPGFLANTALVCQDSALAEDIRMRLSACGRSDSMGMSIVALSFGDEPSSEISSFHVSISLYAARVARCAIRMAEKLNVDYDDFSSIPVEYTDKNTLKVPRNEKIPKIISVGTINMDIYAAVDAFPRDGLSVKAMPFRKLPGGKALNQAVAAARLGADVSLVGRVGNDDFGREIYRMVTDVTGHNSGIVTDTEKSTGVAYVLTHKDSSSSVVLYSGANEKLAVKDVFDIPDIFCNADFCLLQTEMDIENLEAIAREAHMSGCKVILKPCGISALPDGLLDNVDYLVPNKEEMDNIFDSGCDMKATVRRFLEKFSGTVIVTCAHEGAFVFSPEDSFRCTALNVADVDSIGASDIFIGSLAYSLATGDSLRNAVVDATYAAGFSITLQGATSVVIDRQLLSALKQDRTYGVEIIPM